MKILMCHNFYRYFGGEDAVVTAQVPLLEKYGNEVRCFFKYSRDLQTSSLRQQIRGGINSIYSKTSVAEFDCIVSDFKPDVIHIHNVFPLLSPSIYAIIQKKQIPVVQTIHNFRWVCPNGLFFTQGHLCTRCAKGNTLFAICSRCLHGNWLQSFVYALIIATARIFHWIPIRSGIIQPLNQMTANVLQKYLAIPDERIRILGNFLEDMPYKKIFPTNNRFIYMGRLSPEKGLLTLLEAAERFPQGQFEIIGSGPDEFILKEYASAHALSNVSFSGFIPGKERFRMFEGATALILPSIWYEQFPMVILEAFRAGIPVIATRIGGLPDIISEGENGLLFTPGSADSLVDCLKESVDHNTSTKLSKGARDFFLKHYSEASYYPQLMHIYRQALGSR